MKLRGLILAILAGATIVATACSTTQEVSLPDADDRSVSPSPSGSPTIFTPSPGKRGSSDPSSPLPPPTNTIQYEGTGSTKLTREDGETVDLSFDTMGAYSYYGGAKGLSGLVFNNIDDGNTLSVGGILKKGPQKTSTDASLSLFIAGKDGEDDVSFVSGDGACVINLIEATANEFSGTFRCPKAPLTEDETVTVSGSFSGTLV